MDRTGIGASARKIVVCVGAASVSLGVAIAAARSHKLRGAPAFLVTDASPGVLPADIDVLELARPTPGERYFSPDLALADRVYRTVLAAEAPHTIVFVGCAWAALEIVRARRLQGRLAGTGLELVTLPGPAPPASTAPDVLREWAARYVVRHSATVLTPRLDGPGRISVLIPLFNQGRYLAAAIESVRDQSEDVEIVVVNDGSTDSLTNDVFDSLTGVVKVSQENGGVAAARNTALRHATGRYVVPLDADDLLAPGYLDAARDALDGNRELAYVVARSRYIGLLDLVYVPAGFVPELSLFLHTHGKVPGMFRRTALAAVGGYDQTFPAFEDWDMQIVLHRAGYDTDVLRIVGHSYRRHTESMSFTTSNLVRDQLVHRIMHKHLDMLGVDDLRTAALVLTHLWKTGYEPSPSVLLQRRMTESPDR